MRYQLVVCASHPLHEFLCLLDFSLVAIESDYPSLIPGQLGYVACLAARCAVEIDDSLSRFRI